MICHARDMRRQLVEVAAGEPSSLKTEGVTDQNDKKTVETGYTQIPPQDIVSSCPDLAMVILNWEYLSYELQICPVTHCFL